MGGESSLEGGYLGRYRLIRRIGQGGMAEVFLACLEGPAGFERHVAIKRILPHLLEDTELATMFVDEAHLLARLRHPNVVAIEDFVYENDEAFLVMELLEGESLAACMRSLAKDRDRFPFDLSAYIVASAAAGLHAAHELTSPDGFPLHLVHRDVSAQNLFVLYGGHIKVIDFGIAHHRLRLTKTQTGSIKGKLAYMAPEQLTGLPVSRRTDVFALGIVLHELLTMETLFRRESDVAIANAILSDPVPRPSECAAGVPPELDAICMRALARDPNDRFPTAQAMCNALQRFVAVRTASELEGRLSRWMRRTFASEVAAKREWTKEVALPADDAETDPTNDAQVSWALEATAPRPLPESRPPRPITAPTRPSLPPRPSARPPSSGSQPIPVRSSVRPPPPSEARDTPRPFAPTLEEYAPNDEVPESFIRPPEREPLESPSVEVGPSLAPAGGVPKAALWAIVGLTALGAGSAAMWGWSPPEREPSIAPPTVVAIPTVPAAAEPSPPEPIAPPEPEPIAPAVPDTVALEVTTQPPGAEIWLGGDPIGVTPLLQRIPRGVSRLVLEIRESGETVWRDELVPDHDQRVDFARRPQRGRPRPRSSVSAGIDGDYQ